jgi:hypothetical protein
MSRDVPAPGVKDRDFAKLMEPWLKPAGGQNAQYRMQGAKLAMD